MLHATRGRGRVVRDASQSSTADQPDPGGTADEVAAVPDPIRVEGCRTALPQDSVALAFAEPDPARRALRFRDLDEHGLDTRPGIGVRDGMPDLAWCPVP